MAYYSEPANDTSGNSMSYVTYHVVWRATRARYRLMGKRMIGDISALPGHGYRELRRKSSSTEQPHRLLRETVDDDVTMKQ